MVGARRVPRVLFVFRQRGAYGGSSSGTTPSSPSELPAFSGPWAQEFASSYRAARSPFEREALEDGTVTDAEFAEMQARLTTCLSGRGITFSGFQPDGSFEYALGRLTPAEGNAAVQSCDSSSGYNTVGILYLDIRRNPQNLPNDRIISQCLVKNGAVPEGYSAKDYDRDAPDGTFPYTDTKKGPIVLARCAADPLDVQGSR